MKQRSWFPIPLNLRQINAFRNEAAGALSRVPALVSQRFSQRKTYPELLPATIHPLIIIPGIIGTWPPAPAPRGKIDPLTMVYDNLIEGLETLGYVRNVSLFTLPYNWRLQVDQTAEVLAAESKRIRSLPTGKNPASPVIVDYSKINVLGHSMGGLLARAYIQSASYQGEINRLFLVAVPNQGSIAAYYAMEGGDTTKIGIPAEGAKSMIQLAHAHDAVSFTSRVQLTYQALRNLQPTPDLRDYLRQNIRSIFGMLPLASTNYLYTQNADSTRQPYPYGHPENSLLERLNQPENLGNYNQIKEIICYYGNALPTLAQLQVEQPTTANMYPYGQPVVPQPAENFEPGDNIVTATSAKFVLPPTRPDGAEWQVLLRHYDSIMCGQGDLSHVGVVGDPEPVRFLLNFFTTPDAPPVTSAMWDGVKLSERRLNFPALVL